MPFNILKLTVSLIVMFLLFVLVFGNETMALFLAAVAVFLSTAAFTVLRNQYRYVKVSFLKFFIIM